MSIEQMKASSPLEPPFKVKPPWSLPWRWSPLQAPFKAPLKPPWRLQAPLKPPLSPLQGQAPFKPPWSPLQAPLKPPRSPLQRWSPLQAPFKPPWSPLQRWRLQAPFKPPWSPLQAPFKPPLPKVKPPWSLPKVKPPSSLREGYQPILWVCSQESAVLRGVLHGWRQVGSAKERRDLCCVRATRLQAWASHSGTERRVENFPFLAKTLELLISSPPLAIRSWSLPPCLLPLWTSGVLIGCFFNSARTFHFGPALYHFTLNQSTKRTRGSTGLNWLDFWHNHLFVAAWKVCWCQHKVSSEVTSPRAFRSPTASLGLRTSPEKILRDIYDLWSDLANRSDSLSVLSYNDLPLILLSCLFSLEMRQRAHSLLNICWKGRKWLLTTFWQFPCCVPSLLATADRFTSFFAEKF